MVGLVGESSLGKSITHFHYETNNEISMIFQEPMNSLNPLLQLTIS